MSGPHESARAHVTGAALYTGDLEARFPALLHAWPVLAPHAHAVLTALDPAPALAEPGVVTVLTGASVPGEGDTGPARHDEPLFPETICFHSQPVAWVLAGNLEAARRGAARVHASYDPRPAILTLDDAIAAESFHAGPARLSRGDAEAALAASPVIIEGELRLGGQEHFYLETQTALAWLDESGGIALHSSTQHPSETQDVVARVLGLGKHQVRVECLRMGGAFGGKESQANPWAAIAALGAWITRRPVLVRLPRSLDMVLTGKRHPYLARFRAGFQRDGRLDALHARLYSDGGWSLDLSEPILWRSLFHLDNAYRLPHADLAGWVCRTHKTSQTAFRGFGGPQGMVIIEDILDRAARTLGLPPDEVRERNFYQEGDTTHYGAPVKDASRIERIWRELKASSHYDDRRLAIDTFNADNHRLARRGLAMTPVKFGISFTATFFNQGAALVLVYRDGTVQVNHGGTEMGQGLMTKIRWLAARELGIAEEWIRLMPTDTAKVPNTSATAASAGTDLNGAAVIDACRQIKARLDASLPWPQAVEAAYRQRVPLSATGFHRTPDIWFDYAKGQGQPFHYFAYGAAVSEVEVDGYTGATRILRVDILHDAGDSFAPLIDRGQIEGGFVQGAGWLTLEDLRWDDLGRVATAGASTYKLPSWSEMPAQFNVALLDGAREPGGPAGSKAIGEPPLMLAISVREAIKDAISAFRGGRGPVLLDSPATPERVFFALRAAD